jgi:hypothetical protein
MNTQNALVNLSGTQSGITGSHSISYVVMCGLVSGTDRYTPIMVDDNGVFLTSGVN